MKRLLFLLMMFMTLNIYGQTIITDTGTLRDYITTYIKQNGQKQITGQRLSDVFNGFLNTWPGYLVVDPQTVRDNVGGILSNEFVYEPSTPRIRLNQVDWSKVINAPAFITSEGDPTIPLHVKTIPVGGAVTDYLGWNGSGWTNRRISYTDLTNLPTIPQGFTNELAQDAIGLALSAEFTYDDVGNAISINTVPSGKITGTLTSTFISDFSTQVQTIGDGRYLPLNFHDSLQLLKGFPAISGTTAGKYLTNNGTSFSWSTVVGGSSYTDANAISAVGGVLSTEFTYSAGTPLISISSIAANKITGTKTSAFISDFSTASQTVGDARYAMLSGTYANPSFISSLPYTKITGAPTSLSSFTNNVGFITSESDPNVSSVVKAISGGTNSNQYLGWNGTAYVARQINYNDLSNLPSIPTQYTDEMVQDVVGTYVQNGTGISWVYNDASNTLTPTVSLSSFSTSNLTEGSNLYFTNARFDTRFSTKNTDSLAEGTNNKYFTTSRFDASFSGKSTTNLTEGSNLYYTDERVDDRLANLIQGGTGITWTYNDASNTLTPAVSLSPFTTTNLTEGTNLYFTNERSDDRVAALLQNGTGITWTYNDVSNVLTPNVSLSSFSTTNLAEGTNLYYTDSRFDTRFSSKTTSNLVEGSNLYYTDERVDDRVAALFVQGSGISLSYNDAANTFTISSTATASFNPTITSPLSGQFIRYNGTTWVNATPTKSDVGLSNVSNVDATNPANISQTSSFRFVTDAEKSTWNGKQSSITTGTTAQYFKGDLTLGTLDKSAVGLSNVQNVDQTNAANLTSGSIAAARYGATTIPVSAINATGTASSTTYLRGDGQWVTVSGGSSFSPTITSPSSGQLLRYNGSAWVNYTFTKSDIGLDAVENIDATNPANISQSESFRFVTDAEKTLWSGKQDALSGTGFVKISGTTISYDNSTYITSETDPSTFTKLLTGFTPGDDAAIASTDNIFSAFQKTQGQINNLSSQFNTSLSDSADLYVAWPLKQVNDSTWGIDKADATHDGYLDSLDYIKMFVRQTVTDPTGTFTVNANLGTQAGISFATTGARTLAFSNISAGNVVKISINNTSGGTVTLTLPSNSFVAGTGSAASVTIPTGRSMLTLSDYDGTNFMFVQQSY